MINDEFQTLVLEKLLSLDNGQKQLSGDIQAVRTELKEELQAVRAELKEDIQSIRHEMATKEDIAKLDAKVDKYGYAQQEDVIAILQLINEKINAVVEDVKSNAEITGIHEMRIRTLSRCPIAKEVSI